MATNSWNTPGLTKPIQEDVPHMQEKLAALLKQDPTSIEDIPVGAKRLVEISTGKWQLQQFNGESWEAVKKLVHDADTVDSYHAAITPNANTIAVRGADKKLQGDITGNAATATSATTLSRTLPINKGGTGATTSAAARTNLGAAPVAHASSAGTYGLATDTNYGHVRSDGTTTKIAAGEVVVKDVAIGGDTADTASSRGQIGSVLADLSIDDFNDVTDAGVYFLLTSTASSAANRPPTTLGGFLIVEEYKGKIHVRQIYFVYNSNLIYTREKNLSTWSAWNQIITNANTATTSAYGITKLTSAVNSTVENLAATPKAVKTAYDKAVAAYNLADGIEISIATTAKAGIVRPSTGLTIDAAGLLKVNLNNTVTSTSTAQAATANAAKMAYDKAVAAYNLAGSSFSVPDFKNKVKKVFGTQYTADKNGFVYALAFASSWCNGFYLVIDGYKIRITQSEHYGANTSPIIVPIKKGMIYKTEQVVEGSGTVHDYGEYSELYFLPIKG